MGKLGLRGNCIPNQQLACFVLYLKIITIFLSYWSKQYFDCLIHNFKKKKVLMNLK